MATSGFHQIAVTQWNSLAFRWTMVSQSNANNSTTISWELLLYSASGSGIINSTASKTYSVTVNGTKYTGKNTVGIAGNTMRTLASGTTTIAHNADGSKTFNFSYSQQFDITFAGEYVGTKSGSGQGTLPAFARVSQPSLVTWPETTNDVGYFGETFSIHMNREVDSFTHTVRYEYGSRKGTIATGVTTGTTWAVPLEFMNDIPNATSASGRIYADTYSGSTLVGTKYTGFTVKVPASVKPTCSLVLEDINGIDDIYGSPVQGLSRIQITVKPTLAYSSPITSYAVTANGANYSTATSTTDLLKNSGSSPVTATVKDKRGRSGSASYTMNVLAYTPPTISALTVHRCDADGTENDQGEYIRVGFDATVTSLSSKNTATYTLRYKKSDDTSWSAQTLTAYKNKFTVSGGSAIIAADSNSSYDVELTVTDRHHSAVRTTSASTAFTLMNWGEDGTSMGIGKVVETPGTLEVGLDSHFFGTVQTDGNRYAFSSPGIAGTGGFVLMARVEIIAANADTPITFVFTRRQAAAPMTVHLRLSNPTATASTLATIRYEGDNYGAYAYSPSPLVWNVYVLKGSNYDTITLQDWYTSRTMDSRVRVTFPGELVDTVPTPYHRATPAPLESLLDYVYPVGSVYISYSHVSPAELFGGTWTRIENAFLWAVDADGTIGQTGGSKTHTLTVDELPSHSHGSVYSQHASGTKDKAWYNTAGSSVAYGPVATGGGAAHNNMPPYIQVSVWRRTA